MKISVAIAALNEGMQLPATIASCLAQKRPPDEVVVVDDNSRTPQIIPAEFGTRIIRNESRTGSGPAKHKAAQSCTGELIVVLDGHMRLPVDFFEIIEQEAVKNPDAILCPRNHGLESNSKHNGMGADLRIEQYGFWEVKCAAERPGLDSYPIPAVIGGCYVIPRHVLERVFGYAPGFLGYGVEEEFLSLRAWIMGFKVLVVPRTEVWHYYGRVIDRKTADGSSGEGNWECFYNRHVVAYTCFEGDAYSRVYRPMIEKKFFNSIIDRKMKENHTQITTLRKQIQSKRKVSDAALGDLCGVVHPYDLVREEVACAK